MNNPELTKWLQRVRDALAESDEVRRNSMLRAAERFLKESNQQSNMLGPVTAIRSEIVLRL